MSAKPCESCLGVVTCWKHCPLQTHGYQLEPARSLQAPGAMRAGTRQKQKKRSPFAPTGEQ